MMCAMLMTSCEFNMDTACVELKFADGCMICNDPVAYAELILNRDPVACLKNVTEYKILN